MCILYSKGHRNSSLFHSDNTSPMMCLDEPIQTHYYATMLFGVLRVQFAVFLCLVQCKLLSMTISCCSHAGTNRS